MEAEAAAIKVRRIGEEDGKGEERAVAMEGQTVLRPDSVCLVLRAIFLLVLLTTLSGRCIWHVTKENHNA